MQLKHGYKILFIIQDYSTTYEIDRSMIDVYAEYTEILFVDAPDSEFGVWPQFNSRRLEIRRCTEDDF